MNKQIRDQIIYILITLKENFTHWTLANAASLLDKNSTILQSLCDVMRQELSPARADYYIDIFKGLILAYHNSKADHINTTNIETVSKLNIDILDLLIKELKKDYEIKKEIIFLPYKASMWDSLESIWQAAAEDKEHCDAYVIPIPYYDRNPDGTPAQWHYEGDQFPSYVPITDFRKYNLSERRPDVIFIHNPYDGYNRITSVDSKYYSSELKKYTDMLVYVPYFVSGPSVSASMCKIPSIAVTDHIIVESEQIKKQYETYYPCGNPPKNKFLALGSPKFDKILTMKKEDFILPPKWKKLINNKKIILYNTSLAAILKYPDKVNTKLRYVLSIFKNCKDVILWWRPHPLITAALKSMCPEIFYEYQQLEQSYKIEGWGIYDDTADLHRAIAWSDAYYGDMSSVVWLYNVTGRSIMIQNMTALNISRDWVIYNIQQGKNDILFLDVSSAAVYDLSLDNGSLALVVQIPAKFLDVFPYTYGAICLTENKIIFLPLFGKDFLEYDLVTKIFSKSIKTDNHYLPESMGAVLQCITYKKYHYFIPTRSSEIIKYDEQNNTYTRLTKWFSMIAPYIRNDLDSTYHSDLLTGSCTWKNKLFLPVTQTNIILELNMETDKFKLHKIGNAGNIYQDIAFDGENFWLLSRLLYPLVKWNYATGKIVEYSAYLNEIHALPNYLPYYNIAYLDGKIHLYPYNYKYHTILDSKTGKIVQNIPSNGKTSCIKKTEMDIIHFESEISLFSNSPCNIYWQKSRKMEKIYQLYNFATNKNLDVNKINYNGIFEENRVLNILEFITLQSTNNNKNVSRNSSAQSGLKIFNYINHSK